MPDYVWEPLAPDEVAQVFGPLGVEWWIAGGVAIDLFVGRQTREHGDLDVAMLRRDVAELTPLLPEWDICIAHDGKLTPWDGTPLTPEQHQFWARRRGAQVWAFEILLELTDGHDWLYRRDPRIRRRVPDIGSRTATGTPYLAPEICLLYKAPRAVDVPRNAADFDSAAPPLDPTARAWLRDAIVQLDPQHPWIDRLR